MKTFFVIILLLLLPHLTCALEVPQLRGRVNDYANMLSPGTAERLEQLLACHLVALAEQGNVIILELVGAVITRQSQ